MHDDRCFKRSRKLSGLLKQKRSDEKNEQGKTK